MERKKQVLSLILLVSLVPLGDLRSVQEITNNVQDILTREEDVDNSSSEGGSGKDEDKESMEEDIIMIDDNVSKENLRVKLLSKEEKEAAEHAKINNGSKHQETDGSYAAHGDVLLYLGEEEKVFPNTSDKEAGKSDVTALKPRLWPGGVMPYRFNRRQIAKGSAIERSIFMGMDEIEAKSCVRFRKKNRNDKKYVLFVADDGCKSFVGRANVSRGKEQRVSIQAGCDYRAIAVHEILHALGFYHEQERADRDSYVKILWKNIEKGKETNFGKTKASYATTSNQPYDFESVMHYGKDDFGKKDQYGNHLQTIKKIGDSNANFGQPLFGGMSKIDQRQLNILYCETPKMGRVQDELDTTIRHTLQEYDGTNNKDFPGVLKKKLSKMYADYLFNIMQLDENVVKINFAFQHNGNCVGPVSQFGRTLVICWIKRDSFDRAKQLSTAFQVYCKVRKAIKKIEDCNAANVADVGYSVARKNKRNIPIASMFFVREQRFRSESDSNRLLRKVECGSERVRQYYMIMYFGS